jgi:hypothetical protein
MALAKCKECGNQMSTMARTCPRCGAPGAASLVAAPTAGEGLGYSILLLPLGTTFMIWFWIGSMNLLQDPASSLTMLGVATILGTATLAAIEASQGHATSRLAYAISRSHRLRFGFELSWWLQDSLLEPARK